MENYTSDSGSDDNNTSSTIIDLAYLLLSIDQVNHSLISNDHNNNNKEIEQMILHHNQLASLPSELLAPPNNYPNLRVLDISNNGLEQLPDVFITCPHLHTLCAKNNHLTNHSLSKQYITNELRELNLSGNCFDTFPDQLFTFTQLKYLYLGGNSIGSIPKCIWKLHSLQILSMGGNGLYEVPSSLGQLYNLQALMLCDNRIEHLPETIAQLYNLKSLLLHKNRLKTLPPQIIALRNLTELSLRDNPLVVRFISTITHQPVTLLELSARIVKLYNKNNSWSSADLPVTLITYLESAHHCLNPRCKGVYFDNRVEHIKFVDFCGKYRIPLLQYLCSTKCASDTADDEAVVRPSRSYLMKKVLLG